MGIFKIILGLLLIFIAWTYLFHNKLIFRLNTWMRENVFNDQVVLFSGRRVAILLVVLGAVALFSGLEGIVQFQEVKPHIAAQIIGQAKQDLAQKKYKNAVYKCRTLLKTNPNSIEAWELLVQIHSRMGEKELARKDAQVLLRLDPAHPLGKSIYLDEKNKIQKEKE